MAPTDAPLFMLQYEPTLQNFGLNRDTELQSIFSIVRDGSPIPGNWDNVEYGVHTDVSFYCDHLGMLHTEYDGQTVDTELVEICMKYEVPSVDNMGFFLASTANSNNVFNTRVVAAPANSAISQLTSSYGMFMHRYVNYVTPGMLQSDEAAFYPLPLADTQAARVLCFVGLDDPDNQHRKIRCGIDILVCVQ